MFRKFFRKRRLRKDASTIRTGMIPLREIHSAAAVINIAEPGWDDCLKSLESFCKAGGISLSVLFIDLRKPGKGEETGSDRDRTITRKDINWFGRPDLKKAAIVTGHPTDLFLCLADDTSFCIEYLSRAAKARFKIGRKPFPDDPFDLIVAERLPENPGEQTETPYGSPGTTARAETVADARHATPDTAKSALPEGKSVIGEIFRTVTEIITKIE